MVQHPKSYLLLLLTLCLMIPINSQGVPTVEPPPTVHTTQTTTPTASPTASQHVATPKQQKTQQIIHQNKITVDNQAKTIQVIPQPQATAHTITTGQTQLPKLSQHSVQSVTFDATDGFAKNIDPITENVVQNQQNKAQQEQRRRQQNQVHPWIAAELQNLNEANQIKTHQIFSFEITKQVEFKWNPSQFKSGPLRFVVEVFNFNRGDIYFPTNSEEDDYVEVFAQPDSSTMFMNLGKVYIKKVFTINFFSDFQILRFKNFYEQKMFIQISLQATKFVPQKALDDDDLKIPSQKIKSILEQLEQTQKKREKSYKQEWSFRDRQQRHQSQMLILTGLELLVIIGTAFIQIYCIKNLFDNRLIV